MKSSNDDFMFWTWPTSYLAGLESFWWQHQEVYPVVQGKKQTIITFHFWKVVCFLVVERQQEGQHWGSRSHQRRCLMIRVLLNITFCVPYVTFMVKELRRHVRSHFQLPQCRRREQTECQEMVQKAAVQRLYVCFTPALCELSTSPWFSHDHNYCHVRLEPSSVLEIMKLHARVTSIWLKQPRQMCVKCWHFLYIHTTKTVWVKLNTSVQHWKHIIILILFSPSCVH